MDYERIYYPETKFGGLTDIDATVAFFTRVNSLIDSSRVVLDVGCGRGGYGKDPIRVRRELRILRGKCRKVIGIDIDQAAEDNPFLDEFRLIEGRQWPLEDASVDVCVCDHVLEHVEDPELFFSECRRVIKEGGYLCIRTTNVLGYVGLFSMLIPNRFHAAILGRVGVKEEDVFPCLYRCNTKRRIRYMLSKYGFEHYVYGYGGQTAYLSFSRFLYQMGVIHQRLAPDGLKIGVHAFGRKKATV